MAKKLQKGKLNQKDREKIEDIIFAMEKASFCAFGSFAVNGWRGLVEKFPDEIFE